MPRENKKSASCIYDEEDELSLYSRVPETVRIGLRKINPSWLNWSEATYRKKFRISKRDEILRLRFWTEHDLMIEHNRSHMSMTKVYRGACSREYWEQKVLTDPGKLGFIMVMPRDLQDNLKRLHNRALDALDEIFDLPTDHKNIAKKLEAFKYLDQRVQGGIVQRSETKNYNVTKKIDERPLPQTVAEIDAEIASLEAGKAKVLPVSRELNNKTLESSPEALDITNSSPGESVE